MRLMAGWILTLAVAGCASSPNEGRTREDVVFVGSQDGRTIAVPIKRDDFAPTTLVGASAESVWALLPVVYEEVGLPPPAADAATRTVAVQNHVMMRRIGDQRMSTLLECGREVTGENADTHRIRLSVRTWVVPSGNSAEVRTRVEATATAVEGRAGTFPCSSRGQLEWLIANALRTRIAGD